MISMYIRGESSSCLVKVPDQGDQQANAELARDVAVELGIYPEGSAKLVYPVLDQDEWFYDRLITEDQAKEILADGQRPIQ